MRKINIAVFDGGGARGTTLIEMLDQFEKNTGESLFKNFDFFSGTSTGGIIAALYSLGYSAQEIKRLYTEHGPKIFEPSFWRRGLFRSKYSDKYFNKVLKGYFGDETLSDCKKALLIPAYNVSIMDKVLFKSTDAKDANYLLRDVVRSTASAPTFFDPHIINSQVYVDGGLVINNAALVCLIEAMKMGGTEINILSFGTGRTEKPLTESKLESGILKNASALFDIVLTEQVQTVDYMTKELFNRVTSLLGRDLGTYLRAECVIKLSSGEIDDFSRENIENMLADGRTSYNLNRAALKEFLYKTR